MCEFKEVDRALLDGEEKGFVKSHVRKGRDEILGAAIVAGHAGEMISQISVAMAARVTSASKPASVIHPYPNAGRGDPSMRRCLQSNPIDPHREEMDGALAGVAEKLRRLGMSELRRRLIIFCANIDRLGSDTFVHV